MKEERYEICHGRHMAQLRIRVNEKMEAGYLPTGSIVVTDDYYYQPMIKLKEIWQALYVENKQEEQVN